MISNEVEEKKVKALKAATQVIDALIKVNAKILPGEENDICKNFSLCVSLFAKNASELLVSGFPEERFIEFMSEVIAHTIQSANLARMEVGSDTQH